MKKLIISFLALAHVGFSFAGESQLIEEAKNYKLSNGQTIEQAFNNYYFCDNKKWDHFEGRAIFSCRDTKMPRGLSSFRKGLLNTILAQDIATLNTIDPDKNPEQYNQYKEAIEKAKRNPIAATRLLLKQYEQINTPELKKFYLERTGISVDESIKSANKLIDYLKATNTEDFIFLTSVAKEDGNLNLESAYFIQWKDEAGNQTYDAIWPLSIDVDQVLTNNIALPLYIGINITFFDKLTDLYLEVESGAKEIN